jgi:hypothetical protein
VRRHGNLVTAALFYTDGATGETPSVRLAERASDQILSILPASITRFHLAISSLT